jgi:DNA polymerase-1
MSHRLFLLDGMALIYRAHFAFIARPIFNSRGMNTSALLGFANTLLDLRQNHRPTHLALALDTPEPTARHRLFAEYKAQRQEAPEDILLAIPAIERLAAAFRIPVLKYPGYEADDIIGTLARRAERAGGWETFMVTPDKDFGQLVDTHTFQMKPGRQGGEVEILDPAAIRAQWQVTEPRQVAEVLALWGDASDNIPGVEGIGEKTAKKLIAEFGTVENLLAHADRLSPKQREKLLRDAEQARLARRLVEIDCDVPVREALEDLVLREPDEPALRAFCVEFEFNAIGRRLFGDDFKAGRGSAPPPPAPAAAAPAQMDLFATAAPEPAAPAAEEASSPPPGPLLRSAADTPHTYHVADTPELRAELAVALSKQPAFCFDTETEGLEARHAPLVGLSFAWTPGEAWYVPVPPPGREAAAVLEPFRAVFADPAVAKVAHNLKFDLAVLAHHGLPVRGALADTMIAHFLVDPDQRHGMDFLSERYLGYSPIPITALIGDKKSAQLSMREVPREQITEYAAEDADVTWQLWTRLRTEVAERGQKEVFETIEMPLVPVLTEMEAEGVRVDPAVLADLSASLAREIEEAQARVLAAAGRPFNLNSPKQLGEILFDHLRLSDKPRKTATGQYATNEETLLALAGAHPIVRAILEYRELTKLKGTYVDALPGHIDPSTGRVHTSFHQTGAATGRLASQNPNLQNIPIRSERGQEIRRAFVARDADHRLLSADYSQIELRVMTALSGDAAMREAFLSGHDIHAATAARVNRVPLDGVTPEMRRQAKMVNFGIIYGISAHGLAQRLGIPRAEAAELIRQYFETYPGIQAYMEQTVARCRELGYVETLSGRRRPVRDIRSANLNTRQAAERAAINAPIQGTAADMIKLAMIAVQRHLREGGFATRMVLTVHDELLFDTPRVEIDRVIPVLRAAMENALPLPGNLPVKVEIGQGANWLDAH